jgi:hypothetical protein
MPSPEIPGYWTPEQAFAVYQFLTTLCDRLWDRYQVDIVDQLRDSLANSHHDPQLDLFPRDDDLPF